MFFFFLFSVQKMVEVEKRGKEEPSRRRPNALALSSKRELVELRGCFDALDSFTRKSCESFDPDQDRERTRKWSLHLEKERGRIEKEKDGGPGNVLMPASVDERRMEEKLFPFLFQFQDSHARERDETNESFQSLALSRAA